MQRDEQPSTQQLNRADAVTGLLLFVAAMIAYHLNGDLYVTEDAVPSALLAESVLDEGNLSFTVREISDTVAWTLQGQGASTTVELAHFDEHVAELMNEGFLEAGTDYCVGGRCVPTIRDGLYANTFAPGAGLTAVPVFGALRIWLGPLREKPRYMWWAGKLVASLCVAGSVVLVFFTARPFVTRAHAALLAGSYGLATCVWTISSQALWQHGPNELFLTLGVFFLVRIDRVWWFAPACGLALAAATWCRPTGAIVVVAVGLYLLICNRRALIGFVLAGFPLAIAMATYNQHYFGSPLVFGQTRMQQVAFDKTGSTEMWQTPPWIGLPGLLISPSRGLFVYSPFLVFGVWGMWRVLRGPSFVVLRPLAVAILVTWFVESMHYDWWGGWSYGYRHIVDSVPYLSLMLIPILPSLQHHPWLRGGFAMLVAWSFFVQVLGAWTFNMTGWNAREAYGIRRDDEELRDYTFSPEEAARAAEVPGTTIVPTSRNVDRVEHRRLLWSVTDSQLAYYATHWREAREKKRQLMASASVDVASRRAATHIALGRAWLRIGEFERAIERFCYVQTLSPDLVAASYGLTQAYSGLGRSKDAVVLLEELEREALRPQETAIHLAMAHLCDDNVSQAIAQLDRAMRLDPVFELAVFSLILEQWKPVLQMCAGPDKVQIIRQANEDLYRGLRAWQSGKLDMAEDLLTSESGTATDIPSLLNRLGQIRLQRGVYDSATSVLEAAIQGDADLTEAHTGLGIVNIRQGNVAEALRHFAEATRRRPNDGAARRRLEAARRLDSETAPEAS